MRPIPINRHVYIAFGHSHHKVFVTQAVALARQLIWMGSVSSVRHAVSLFSADVDDAEGGLDCP